MATTPNYSWPTPDDSDYVKDGALAMRDLGDAIDATVFANFLIRQVVTTVKTDTYSASVARGAETGDVTGLTASITPGDNTNKVLVIAQLNLANSNSDGDRQVTAATLYRGGSAITGSTGDAASNRQRITGASAWASTWSPATTTLVYLDSPASAASVTYSVRLRQTDSGTLTVYLNRAQTDTDVDYVMRTASTLTLLEVAA